MSVPTIQQIEMQRAELGGLLVAIHEKDEVKQSTEDMEARHIAFLTGYLAERGIELVAAYRRGDDIEAKTFTHEHEEFIQAIAQHSFLGSKTVTIVDDKQEPESTQEAEVVRPAKANKVSKVQAMPALKAKAKRKPRSKRT